MFLLLVEPGGKASESKRLAPTLPLKNSRLGLQMSRHPRKGLNKRSPQRKLAVEPFSLAHAYRVRTYSSILYPADELPNRVLDPPNDRANEPMGGLVEVANEGSSEFGMLLLLERVPGLTVQDQDVNVPCFRS